MFDSDLNRDYTDGNPDGLNTSSVLFYPMSYGGTTFGFPSCLVKSYRIEALDESGFWKTVFETDSNYQRFVRLDVDVVTTAIRLIPLSTYRSEKKNEDYGSSTAHIFAFEVR